MKTQLLLTVGMSAFAIASNCLLMGNALAATASSNTLPAPGPNYTASRFPGVKVRHVPGPQKTASQTRSMAMKRKGIAISNVRPISKTRPGYMADVDSDTHPNSIASKSHSGQSRGKYQVAAKAGTSASAHQKP